MKKRTTISLDEDRMNKLDDIAEYTDRTRSGLISLLIGWLRRGKRRGDIIVDRDGNDLPKDD